MMTTGDSPHLIRVTYETSIPQLQVFARPTSPPLVVAGSEWETASTVIDFACALVGTHGHFRRDKHLRDAGLLALLRRAILTTEGVQHLLRAGLLEPAIAGQRTLLDIELAARLIHADPTDHYAYRLAAYHYLTYQRHAQDMLGNRDTRTNMLQPAGRVPEVIEVAKSYARLLEGSVFDSVREDIKLERLWHGFPNVEEAFKSVGQESDYHMTYDSATWFVHASNVDYDYDPNESNADNFELKPMTCMDANVIRTFLGHTVFRLHSVLTIYIAERGLPDSAEFKAVSRIRYPDGDVHGIDCFDALTSVLVSAFPRQVG